MIINSFPLAAVCVCCTLVWWWVTECALPGEKAVCEVKYVEGGIRVRNRMYRAQ